MQNNSVKISIIMPIYNVAEYLAIAIESVINQSFTEFELILVDDGSSDESPSICDRYEKLDKRIKVIHQKNQGAHIARNNAINIASGEYVCFFDADDYIDKYMLSDLYDLAIKYKSNLVISGFYIHTYYNEKEYITLDYIPNIDSEVVNYDNKVSFRKEAYINFDKNMFYSPWNKLYKLSYIRNNNITFPKTYRDDFPFVLSVIRDIDNVTYTKKQYYHFIRKRADSETQKYVANLYEKREEEHKSMLDLFVYWNLSDDFNSREMIARRYIDRLIECMVNLFNKECLLSKNEKKEKIKDYLSTDNFKDSIKIANPKKAYLKIMYVPLRLRNVSMCYMMAKFINSVKSKDVKTFSLLKTNR